nr:translation initiation factor IF-3 [Clostridium gasigenes]
MVHFAEVKNISKKFICNEDIREREIRVIGHDGSQLGIMATNDAQEIADEKDCDLVMISPTAKPPVCRIMDLGKHIYEQAKKDKDAKKSQKVVVLKEIRCSLNIEENDITIKAKNARKFLLDGDKVKITVRFKGREATLGHMGKKILENFFEKLEDICIIEKYPRQEGRNMTMIVGPKKA